MKWDHFALCISKKWTLCTGLNTVFTIAMIMRMMMGMMVMEFFLFHNNDYIIIIAVVVVVCLFFFCFLLFSLAKLKHLAPLNEKRDCIH